MTKASAIVDTFDAANAALTYYGPATRTAGQLVMPMLANTRTDPESGNPLPTSAIQSTNLVDLGDSYVLVELVRVPTTLRSTVNLTVTEQTHSGFVSFEIVNGTIRAVRYVWDNPGLNATGWSAPYDPIAHRWLKIRSERGSIVWSTSFDGREWVDRAVLVAPFPVSTVRFTIAGYLHELADPGSDDGLDPGNLIIDNLNAPPPLPGTDPLTTIGSDGGAPNLAIDVLPSVGKFGTFTLNRSRLDGVELLGWGYGAQWSNIVCDVQQVQITRGSTGAVDPLDQVDAGTLAVVLTDTERRFDPTINADAIHPRTPIRVRAWAGNDPAHPLWSEVLFTGKINGDGIAVDYARTGPPTVTINASDLIGTLTRWESTGYPEPGTGAGDDLLDRVQRVLADAEQGIVAAGSDPYYTATLGPTILAKAWQAIEDAVTAELGRVWVTNRDTISVHARNSELTGPMRGTLSDWHGESVDSPEVHCCYVNPSVRYSPEQIVNRAIGGRRGSDAALDQLDAEDSQALYGVIALSETGLVLETTEQVSDWCSALLVGHTLPRVRVDRVTPYPTNAPEAWQAVVATDIGDRWHFRLHPEVGATVAQAIGVLGIEHTITPDAWETVWHTIRAPAPGENISGWFTLNVSTLNGGDVLAPFG